MVRTFYSTSGQHIVVYADDAKEIDHSLLGAADIVVVDGRVVKNRFGTLHVGEPRGSVNPGMRKPVKLTLRPSTADVLVRVLNKAEIGSSFSPGARMQLLRLKLVERGAKDTHAVPGDDGYIHLADRFDSADCECACPAEGDC